MGLFCLPWQGDQPVPEAHTHILVQAVDLVAMALTRSAALSRAMAMATTDELTGLINRRGFNERFESELERARRNQSAVCVALVDVDFFKQVNDTHGHLNGDRVLRQLADALKAGLRKSDLVCRFGGEEFAIVLPDTYFQAAADLNGTGARPDCCDAHTKRPKACRFG